MNATDLAGVIVAAVMVLTMVGAIIAMAFRMGHLSGIITAFMATVERDRSELLVQFGKVAERLDRHIDEHRGVKP